MGVAGIKQAALHYANPVVFLIFGGFVIAVAMQKWHLHRRIALKVLSCSGTRSDALIAGFMAATAAISMWLSNTATTIMMLPIAVSVITLINRDRAPGSEGEVAEDARFATALVLAVAFSASIGGLDSLHLLGCILWVVSQADVSHLLRLFHLLLQIICALVG